MTVPLMATPSTLQAHIETVTHRPKYSKGGQLVLQITKKIFTITYMSFPCSM